MKTIVILLVLSILFAAPVGTESGQQESDSRQAGTGVASEDAQEQLEEFVPSEEISADRAISFPTDI
jgi:hypothetical protein